MRFEFAKRECKASLPEIPATREELGDMSSREYQQDHQTSSSKFSQREIDRCAHGCGDAKPLPLKARNLELLTSQHQSQEQVNNRHGGSAALLHASRTRHGPSEALAYSGFDAHGNPSTETFRPHRTSNRSLCLVEVLEEPVQQRPRDSFVTARTLKQDEKKQRRRSEDLKRDSSKFVASLKRINRDPSKSTLRGAQ